MVIGETWAQSLFRRMGYKRRYGTTSKVIIPDNARNKMELILMHKIVQTVEKYNIPHSLILHADQTPSKYVPTARYTLAEKKSKSVPIAGGSDKQAITANFIETLDCKFLPMGRKTSQTLPKIQFTTGFSLGANPNHYRNTGELIKLLKEIVVSYVEKISAKLDDPKQSALLIWDVFRGQKTESVIEVLNENNIHTEHIPNNTTNYYQPLDLTTNKWGKEFLKTKFSQWYSEQIQNALDNGKAIEDIEVKVPVSVMKPLHGCWLIEMFNELTSARCKKVIESGWERSGILDATTLGSKKLPKLDAFTDIDPLESEEIPDFPKTEEVHEEYKHDEVEFFDESSGSEWEEDETRNAFDYFENDD